MLVRIEASRSKAERRSGTFPAITGLVLAFHEWMPAKGILSIACTSSAPGFYLGVFRSEDAEAIQSVARREGNRHDHGRGWA